VLIPAKNEALNIVECIRHVSWAQQITVIDSGSSDDTEVLAQAMGAEVYRFNYAQESPSGWPKKKNWALEKVPWQHEWVLIFDADEHATPELAAEVEAIVTGKGQPPRGGCGDGYWINRKLIFLGGWIRRCGYYPSWNVRLFKHRIGRYERLDTIGDTGSGDNEVHEHVILTTGEAGWLESDFLHYAYRSIADWVEKHNRYSSWEAEVQLQQEYKRTERSSRSDTTANPASMQPTLFGNRAQRRRFLKKLSLRLPFRPTARFLYHFILTGGFLDGYRGYVLCRLMQTYEFLSVAKHHELKLKSENEA
jgi:glycosyltransferase involved in cell wall biosynthesis